MKVTWEAHDIRAGRRVGKNGRGEQWMIGYSHAHEPDNQYCLVSLTDGCISHDAQSKEELATVLNEAGELPLELLNEELK